jgi:predicted LPLAT superfamily acyltransferase
MNENFYRLLIALTRLMGLWVFRLVAWGIATGYFLLFPGRVAVSTRFYRALYPSRPISYALWCTWKQYHHFTNVYLDRIIMLDRPNMSYTHEGWEYLDDAVNSKSGGIILMSHIGNWEIAAHLLAVQGRSNPGMKLLLYMGRKRKEQIERTQKESLVKRGVKIIAVEEHAGDAVDIIEGITFLKAGGLVSLTGDRIWHKKQRSIVVRFLGHEALLPEGPFVFALLSGAPLLILFACHTVENKYHFQVLPPVYVRAKGRQDRQEAIQKAAQSYACHLEAAVRRYPFEWYHFEPFLTRVLDDRNQQGSTECVADG